MLQSYDCQFLSFKSKNIISYSPIIYTADNFNLFVSRVNDISTLILSLFNAFLVLKLSINFISIGQLCDTRLEVHFSRHGYFVQDP